MVYIHQIKILKKVKNYELKKSLSNQIIRNITIVFVQI